MKNKKTDRNINLKLIEEIKRSMEEGKIESLRYGRLQLPYKTGNKGERTLHDKAS